MTNTNSASKLENDSLRGRYAARILEHALSRALQPIRSPNEALPELPEIPVKPFPKHDYPGTTFDPESDILAIVGAGMSGLYLAMMCDYLGIKYDLFEASDRFGGRVYTYDFPETEPKIAHNYYDVGAMRFPELQTMKP